MSIGDKIRRERHRKGLTIMDLAFQAGIAMNTLYKIERSKIAQPRASTIQKICDCLDIQMERVMNHTPNKGEKK